METKKKFGAWLTRKYIEWQTKAGRKSVSDLAEYLDISQSMTSRYMNGKSVPEGENLIKVAIRFGDEVYEVLGVKPPNKDPRLLQINSFWDDLSEAAREVIFTRLLQLREQGESDGQKTRKNK